MIVWGENRFSEERYWINCSRCIKKKKFLFQSYKILSETKDDLRKEGKGFDENIEVGVMIEVPSAAMTADIIAEHADFLSIGTPEHIA